MNRQTLETTLAYVRCERSFDSTGAPFLVTSLCGRPYVRRVTSPTSLRSCRLRHRPPSIRLVGFEPTLSASYLKRSAPGSSPRARKRRGLPASPASPIGPSLAQSGVLTAHVPREFERETRCSAAR